jgi:hypothetical protein
MRKKYYFPIKLVGVGEDPEEAWADAVDAFNMDPGVMEEYEKSDELLEEEEEKHEQTSPELKVIPSNPLPSTRRPEPTAGKGVKRFLRAILRSEEWWSTWIQGNKMPRDIQTSVDAMVVAEDALRNLNQDILRTKYPRTFWFYDNYTEERSGDRAIEDLGDQDPRPINIWANDANWKDFREMALDMEGEISIALGD